MLAERNAIVTLLISGRCKIGNAVKLITCSLQRIYPSFCIVVSAHDSRTRIICFMQFFPNIGIYTKESLYRFLICELSLFIFRPVRCHGRSFDDPFYHCGIKTPFRKILLKSEWSQNITYIKNYILYQLNLLNILRFVEFLLRLLASLTLPVIRKILESYSVMFCRVINITAY